MDTNTPDTRPADWELFGDNGITPMSAEEADTIDTGLRAGAEMQPRWDRIYRAAVCAAADAIRAQDWAAKRQALAVAEQADRGRQVLVCAIFGWHDVPAQYSAMEAAGARITLEQSSAALRAIAADKPAPRKPTTVKRITASASDRAAAAAEREDRVAQRAAETAAAAASAAEQARADAAAGRAALPEIVSSFVGCEWIEDGGVILTDDGRVFVAPTLPESTAADIGRMLRTFGTSPFGRSREIARWAQLLPLRAA